MKALVQRVSHASVKINGEISGKISKGLLVFLGAGIDDTEKDLDYVFEKVVNLRIFPDQEEKMNLSLLDIEGEILIVSQFTLYADTRKGRRPSFNKAMPPKEAEEMYLSFIAKSVAKGIPTEAGVFGADMKVELLNEGPVTIMITS